MPGKKKGGNANPPKGGNSDNKEFKFELGGSGKPEITKETQAALMPVLQDRLNQLIGQDSGYLDTLPQSVQLRIKALKKLQSQHDALQDQFDKEIEALEKKYEGLKNPLYVRRCEIVTGASEPTSEELVGDDKDAEKDVKTEVKSEADVKGIPEFWLLVFKHHYELEALVHPVDEPIMKHITDVRITHPDAENLDTFAIEFLFSDNEYFENKALTKTFMMDTEEGETMLQKITSTEIKWKAGKNITVKMVAQKQGGRGGRRGRGGKSGGGPPKMVEQAVDSFFHFFDDTSDLDLDEEEENELLEQEYDLAMMIRTQIIEDAVKWFTGEVPMMEGDDFEGNEDDEEGDDDDEDDEEEAPAPKGKKGGKGKKTTNQLLNEQHDSEEDTDYDPKTDPKAQQAQPECKQQ